jgi:hypothetical protein
MAPLTTIKPYRFGWRPCAATPYPFNTRQYSKLLVLRGRVRDDLEERSDHIRYDGSAVSHASTLKLAQLSAMERTQDRVAAARD